VNAVHENFSVRQVPLSEYQIPSLEFGIIPPPPPVDPPTTPTIAFSSPLADSVWVANDEVPVSAVVAANGHDITSVRLFVDDVLLAESDEATWTPAEIGTYTLRAEATYDAGIVISVTEDVGVGYPPGPFQMDSASVAVIQGRDHAAFTGLLVKTSENIFDGNYACTDPFEGFYGSVTVNLTIDGGINRFVILYSDFSFTEFCKLDPPPPGGLATGLEPVTLPHMPKGFYWQMLPSWMGTNTIIVSDP